MLKTSTARNWRIHTWNTSLPGWSFLLLCAVLGHLALRSVSLPIHGIKTPPLDEEKWPQFTPVSSLLGFCFHHCWTWWQKLSAMFGLNNFPKQRVRISSFTLHSTLLACCSPAYEALPQLPISLSELTSCFVHTLWAPATFRSFFKKHTGLFLPCSLCSLFLLPELLIPPSLPWSTSYGHYLQKNPLDHPVTAI